MTGRATRTIKQPGSAAGERIVAVEARGRAVSFDLAPGALLIDAVRQGFAAEGFATGVLELSDLALAPFAYVMPALSKTGDNAAFYSDTFRPAGVAHISSGAMTFGRRDNAPFFHCHALWTEADGRRAGGHILPAETTVARSTRVSGLGLDGAVFEANPDPETNFTLFAPISVARTQSAAPVRAFALRLRPNQDFALTLEAFCRQHGITNARLRGGVGSTIGARFVDGRVVENFATEVYIRSGLIAPDASGALQATIDASLVDFTGALAEGRLERGDNPVLMTFELVLEVLGS